jgi:hypothetical protein
MKNLNIEIALGIDFDELFLDSNFDEGKLRNLK